MNPRSGRPAALLCTAARAAPRRRHKADCDPDFFDFLKSDYLRLSHPHFASCYRRAVTLARQKGWQILTEKTALKVVTGGAATRYHFKVKEDDVPGLFTALGCEIHWATPYSGQSKPTERALPPKAVRWR
ncbi:transposase domain-containing protein [Cereibacter johrii]|uniref:transposase domain-containing protein n=1 Tax=Cereibacter johrii TaxID=445629 RepID=UPI003CE73872